MLKERQEKQGHTIVSAETPVGLGYPSNISQQQLFIKLYKVL